MRWPRKNGTTVVALALGWFLLVPPQLRARDGRLPAGAAAVVNGEPIATRLVETFVKNGREVLALELGKAATGEAALRGHVLDELIDRALIVQGAAARGLAPSAAEIAEAERNATETFGGEEPFAQFLKNNGFTREDYRDAVLRQTLCGERLRAALARDVSVSDDDVRTFYEARRDTEPAWQLPERVAASHLLLSLRRAALAALLQHADPALSGQALDEAVAAETTRRRALAADLRRRALEGEDFAALVREFSDDPGTRELGGELTPFPRRAHSREFSAAAFALTQPWAISEVVQDAYGLHLIRLIEHLPARVVTLAEATSEIRARLLKERSAARLREWLREARAKAAIVRAD